MRRRTALAGVLAALAAAPAASAADQTVQAVDGDGTPTNPDRWAPAEVTIRAGESVTWSFAGTAGFHNVASDPARGTRWDFDNGGPEVAKPPASYRFDAPGVYAFLCQAHGSTMTGTVTVTDAAGAPPPPPPPPPLSEQPWPNDQLPPPLLDREDTERPRLSRVRAVAVRKGARVRFRLSERARVVVRFKRARRTVRTVRTTFRAGTHRLTVSDRRMRGRYRVEVLARDRAGNRSRVRRARLTVR